MTQPPRTAYDDALRHARTAAYAPGQFVGQESFMSADEILWLARRAGVGPGVSVLDLCCGVAGPGRLITAQLDGTYLGVDQDAGAVGLARARADGLSCRFEVAEVPPVGGGPFDVVLLLETMLAFRDKQALLREVSTALVPGGRFAFTLEEGQPLTAAEQDAMPAADTVWPVPLPVLVGLLADVGLRVSWLRECTRSHRLVADTLLAAFRADRADIAADLGDGVADGLLASHRLWSEWLTTGRVRKLTLVAEKAAARR